MENQTQSTVAIVTQQLLTEKKIKRCPMGGYCFNPLCLFGCVED